MIKVRPRVTKDYITTSEDVASKGTKTFKETTIESLTKLILRQKHIKLGSKRC